MAPATRIEVVTIIQAPIERVFDAARDLDLHLRTMRSTGERAVAGRTSGLIELGESVTWRARHFGIRQHFTSRITRFERPLYFQDTMERGAFASFVHDHFFEVLEGGTRMTDVVVFLSPLGVLGRIAGHWILRRYMTALIRERAAGIKEAVESA
jgi:ligand-binding SRPBCC domain-containing protein